GGVVGGNLVIEHDDDAVRIEDHGPELPNRGPGQRPAEVTHYDRIGLRLDVLAGAYRRDSSRSREDLLGDRHSAIRARRHQGTPGCKGAAAAISSAARIARRPAPSST